MHPRSTAGGWTFGSVVEALPDLGGALDKILSVNSLGFWTDPVARVSELRCRLSAGGVIAIASATSLSGARPTRRPHGQPANRFGSPRRRLLATTSVEQLELDPPVVCVTAVNTAPAEAS